MDELASLGLAAFPSKLAGEPRHIAFPSRIDVALAAHIQDAVAFDDITLLAVRASTNGTTHTSDVPSLRLVSRVHPSDG